MKTSLTDLIPVTPARATCCACVWLFKNVLKRAELRDSLLLGYYSSTVDAICSALLPFVVFEFKMVTKRMRSEYMKKFKDPKWESYSSVTRRCCSCWSKLTTPGSGAEAPTVTQTLGQEVLLLPGRTRSETLRRLRSWRSVTGRGWTDSPGSRAESRGLCPGCPFKRRMSLQHNKTHSLKVSERQEHQRRREQQTHREQNGGVTGGARQLQSKPIKSSKQPWRSHRVRPAPTKQPKDDSKESRHPFALYASGEKDADMANRKTHNVGPAASTTEIHESALRAKTRRKVERQVQAQGTERRRAKSANVDKTVKSVQPEFNPWLTEYMRCFSARSR
ncbi:hypothetical protein F7725_026151 [Dissostichus mawsoni]|uniref:Uncharacterized protein n=1 Tax=Dissostichus mawsoni TaxID=36200 RepID=A0A7J5X687_DISMA|nr:hypothetical protein F7725_026151 [Dissostichus mawsoni]